jgi:hypothetical protein
LRYVIVPTGVVRHMLGLRWAQGMTKQHYFNHLQHNVSRILMCFWPATVAIRN